MLRSIPSKLFWEWQAYQDLEPFDERRDDYRFASIVAMLANINRDSKKHPKPFPLKDFVLDFGEPEDGVKKSEPVDIEQKLKAMVAAFTGQIVPDEVWNKRS